MAQQTINVGTAPNDGTGTPLRTAFQYTNANFSELYTAVGPSGNNIVCPGTLTVSSGTLALPSLTTAGDTNTGIYFPAADTIGFVEGGVEAMRINSAGNLVVNNGATITGDFTVDISTLKVDSANDRVGVGTASPAAGAKLGVLGATSVSASDYIGSSTWAARFIGSSNGAASGISFLTNSASGLPSPASLHALPVADYRSALVATYSADTAGAGYFAVNRFNPTASTTSEHYKIDNAGVATWSNVGGVAGTAMTLNSTGLGVGTSPSYKLDVLGSATISGRFKTSGALNALYLEDSGTTAGSLYIGTSGNEFRIVTGSNVALAIDVNRNFTIGPTSITTTATDGFVYVPVCAGAPTGTPTAKGGRAAFVVDSTNNRFYVYVGGAWKYAALV